MTSEKSTESKAKPASGSKLDTSSIDAYVGYNLRRAATRQRERFRSVFAPYDIRPVQLTALTLIYYNSGLRQAALGRALDMKRANVVTLLDQLEHRGFAERRPAVNDRRSYEIHLTPKGRKLTAELLALHEKLEADLARSLGEQNVERMLETLIKFRRVSPAPKLD